MSDYQYRPIALNLMRRTFPALFGVDVFPPQKFLPPDEIPSVLIGNIDDRDIDSFATSCTSPDIVSFGDAFVTYMTAVEKMAGYEWISAYTAAFECALRRHKNEMIRKASEL